MSDNKKMPAVPQMEVRKDQSLPEQALSPIATLSSHADPEPFYIASLACAGSSSWLYSKFNNKPAALAAAGFSLLYFSAGRMVVTGYPRLGYDLGSATSLGLVAWTAPGLASKSGAETVLATVGGVSAVANLVKSYQQRTGRPLEMDEK